MSWVSCPDSKEAFGSLTPIRQLSDGDRQTDSRGFLNFFVGFALPGFSSVCRLGFSEGFRVQGSGFKVQGLGFGKP
jgi:hypothetical protein